MSRYEKLKLVLWGVIAGLLLAHLVAERPVRAQERHQVGRYQIDTAVAVATTNNPIERTYVLDTATGAVKRIHAPMSAPTQIIELGETDVF